MLKVFANTIENMLSVFTFSKNLRRLLLHHPPPPVAMHQRKQLGKQHVLHQELPILYVVLYFKEFYLGHLL